MRRFFLRDGPVWTSIWRRAAGRTMLITLPLIPAMIGLLFVKPMVPVVNAVGDYVIWLLVPATYVALCWRELRRLRKLDYRVCLGCNYELASLPDRGCCPECGGAYNVDAVRSELES